MTINLRSCLDQCNSNLICEQKCLSRSVTKSFCETCSNSRQHEFLPPNKNQIKEIMSDHVNGNCDISNYQWTEWNNVKLFDGNDFETLVDHKRLFEYMKIV